MFGPGLLRLFLALMVVVSHASPGRFGVAAVMVFFCLSGYWVARMYYEKYLFYPAPIRSFYLSRFLRLWPAFAVAIFLAMLLRAVRGGNVSFSQLKVLSMLGVASGVPDPLEISWSLDIELQFYLLLPFLLLAASRLSVASAAVAAACLTAAGWAAGYFMRLETVLQYFPAFLAGVAIWKYRISVSRRAALISAVVFLGIGLLLYMNDATRGVVAQAPMPRRVTRAVSLVWALSLIPFVAWNVRLAGGVLDRAMGDFSYSLYLIHYPIVTTIEWMTDGEASLLLFLVKVGLSLLAAIVFFWVIDRPFERLRQRLTAPPADAKVLAVP